MKKLAIVLLIVSVLVGCADEKEKVSLLKENHVEKSSVDTESLYLYVPNVVDAPRTSVATRPHWQGEAKLVKFKFTEDNLEVIEVEKDGRFEENETNGSPVMRIPVKHKAYRCSKDSYGDCTNREEENTQVKWDAKKYFIPNFEGIDRTEANVLPIDINQLFGGCYSEKGSSLKSYDFSDKGLDVKVSKSFKASGSCLNGIESLSDVSFDVEYRYSFVKLEDLTTDGYEPFKYSRAEETTFGYFTTRQHELDEDNTDTEGSESFYLNRWAPNTTIEYYLNDSFNKPEYQKIKKATYKVVENINQSLKAAGAELRVNLNEPKEGVESGDIRHSMIVMVEDPVASGIIGYGPSVANPLTGEIVQAKTVMYLGTLKKFTKRAYDEIIAQVQAEGAALEEGLDAVGPSADTATAKVDTSIKSVSSLIKSQVAEIMHESSEGHEGSPHAGHSHIDHGPIVGTPTLENIKSKVTNLTSLSSRMEDRIRILSKHNAMPGEMFNFHGALKEKVKESIDEIGLKPWASLTKKEKRKILSDLLPYVWVPVLVHEIGHNLGLRHNFAGSEDKDNFYTAEEFEEAGMEPGSFPYSSVMDYTYRVTNELPGMAKYDVAALRFAYAEEVELADGGMVSLDKYRADSSLEVKAYQFCTDEMVGANPTCNRFDEGTNLKEVAEHLVDSYYELYPRTHLRNNRRSFSLFDDFSHVARIHGTMNNLRLFYELYERVKNQYSLDDDNVAWVENEFLAELKESMLIGAQFMVNVIKTPDTMCAIAQETDPQQIVAVLPIDQLTINATSCFDAPNIQLAAGYTVVAEGGVPFQSKKSPYSTNSFADQIDVRGVWIDKLLASQFLFKRELGSLLFDKYDQNYLYVKELRPVLTSLIKDVIIDDLEAPVLFAGPLGSFSAEIPYSMQANHEILPSMSFGARLFLGTPDSKTTFVKEFSELVMDSLPNNVNDEEVREIILSLEVKSALESSENKEDYVVANNGLGESFYIRKTSEIGAEIAKSSRAVKLLSAQSREDIIAAYLELEAEEAGSTEDDSAGDEGADDDATGSEKDLSEIKALGKETLLKFLNDRLKVESEYFSLLRALHAAGEASKAASIDELLGAFAREQGRINLDPGSVINF